MQKAYMEWNAQLAVDHHGSRRSISSRRFRCRSIQTCPQPQYSKWLDVYGRANAAAFDRNKWDYYVRDVYDAFYPGYWDMYPSLNGASV
jgi:hypothetical protein